MGALAASVRGRSLTLPQVRGISGVRAVQVTLAAVCAVVSLLGVLSFTTGRDLQGFFPGVTPFGVNIGIALLAACLAMALEGRRIASALAALCALIGGITFAEHLVGVDLGIDQLFADSWRYDQVFAHPGRMAPNSSLCVMFIGLGVLLRGRAAMVSASLAGLVGMVALLGYTASDAGGLASLGQNVKMALPTAVACTTGAFAVLLHREHAFFARQTVGGTVTRRLAPVVLLLPLVGGALLVSGIRSGTFSAAAGVWVMTVAAVVISLAVLLWISRTVDAQEARAHAGLSLQARTAENLTEGLVLRRESDGVVIAANPEHERIFGYAPGELIGTRTLFLTDENERRMHEAVECGETFTDELQTVRSDGTRFWSSVKASSFDHPEHGRVRVALYRDITDRREAADTERRLQGERAAAIEELSRSNKELEQFAHVASHDLSEPLRVVAGFVGLLQRRYEGKLDEDADKYIAATVSGVERMQALIDALLAYSRVGSDELKLELVDTTRLVGQVKEALGVRIEESGGRVEIDGPLPSVAADPVLLTRVFQNLISNALKFTGDDAPRIEISAEPTGLGEWTFRVRDNGEGIAPEYAERVFGMFQRLHGRDRPGTGIGLSITRRIVEKHGGRIWVEPTEAGGSVFTFTLGATT